MALASGYLLIATALCRPSARWEVDGLATGTKFSRQITLFLAFWIEIVLVGTFLLLIFNSAVYFTDRE